MKGQISQKASASIVFVRKDRERGYDQDVSNQWKEARSIFYLEQISNKLNQAKADQNTVNEIFQMFLNSKGAVDLNKLGKFKQYHNQVKELNRRLLEIQKQFSKKERKCLPFAQVIQQRITNLQSIRIQYQPKLKIDNKEECPYSISAFDLFKVIHQNKSLTEVTLKKVFVQQFQIFIKYLKALKNHEIDQSQSEEFKWMKDLSPPKDLHLTMNTKLVFDTSNKKQLQFQIKNLALFQSIFNWLSHITVEIKVGKQLRQITWLNTLEELWQCLKAIKMLKIKIESCATLFTQQVPLVRSAVFGGLASFTQIDQLQFIGLSFYPNHNDYLAIEQILRNLFENNVITHLKLHHCYRFPMIPKITTLRSIDLNSSTFRKDIDLTDELALSKHSLRSIKCYESPQKWMIDEQMINQLQALLIYRCYRITFGNISPKTPSNIKYLSLSHTDLRKTDVLPKLSRIQYLQLIYNNFKSQASFGIVSPYLQDLIFDQNESLTEQDLQVIDKKCPSLTNLKLNRCPNVTERIWSVCKFNRLREITVNQSMFKQTKQSLHSLKKKGIKIHYW